MQEAGVAFCESEVEVDMASKTVTMSKIFKWYGADFAVEPKARLREIAAFCTGAKQEALNALSGEQGKVNLHYKEYDWSPNSK
jgi:hypothetical protein